MNTKAHDDPMDQDQMDDEMDEKDTHSGDKNDD